MYVSRSLRRARSTRPAGSIANAFNTAIANTLPKTGAPSTTIEVFPGVVLPSATFPGATNNPPPPVYNYVPPPPYPAWLPSAAIAVGAAGAGWLLISLVNRRK